MIKVLNIISDTNIGGAGKVIINFSRNFDNKNFEIMSDFDTELIPESEVGVIIPDDDESDSSTSPVHLVRLVVVLTIICTCVALLLSVVNGVTKDMSSAVGLYRMLRFFHYTPVSIF